MPYEYLQQLWRKHDPELLGWLRQEAVEWRRDPVIMRIRRPTSRVKLEWWGTRQNKALLWFEYVAGRVELGRPGRAREGDRRQWALGNSRGQYPHRGLERIGS